MIEVIINTFLDFSYFDGAMTPLDKGNATRYPLAQKLYLLKSVHFKNTVTQSSFHSKIQPLADIKTKSADVSLKMF